MWKRRKEGDVKVGGFGDTLVVAAKFGGSDVRNEAGELTRMMRKEIARGGVV